MKKKVLSILLSALMLLSVFSFGGVMAAQHIVCPYCGEIDTAGDFICDKCGNDFNSDIACPNCGEIDSDNDFICQKCGQHIDVVVYDPMYFFDFNSDPFSEENGWTAFDENGNGKGWASGTANNKGIGLNGSDCAVLDDDSYPSDEWLFSPLIEAPGTAFARLTWYDAPSVDNWYGFTHYDVYALPECIPDERQSGRLKLTAVELSRSDGWTKREVDLTGIAGNTVYLAFHIWDESGVGLKIDDFSICETHIHDFVYAAENNVLKASCIAKNACWGEYGKYPLSLTLNAPTNLTYDKTAKTTDYKPVEKRMWEMITEQSVPGITYTAKSGSSLTDGKAVDAGDYTVSISAGKATVSVDFTIAQLVPDVTVWATADPVTYGEYATIDKIALNNNGSATGLDGETVTGTFKLTGNAEDHSAGVADSGLYDVVFIPDSRNYASVTAEKAVQVNITAASQTAPETGEGYTVDGEQCVTVTEGYEISAAEDFGSVIATGTKLENGKTYYIRKAADDNHIASPAVSFTVHFHNIVEVAGQEASEAEAGWQPYYECRDIENACGHCFEDEDGLVPIEDIDEWKAEGGRGYIPKLAHEFKDYIYNNDATCTADGTETAKCVNCDETDTRTAVGTKLGHSFTGDCLDNGDGTHSFKCVNGCEEYGVPAAHTGMDDGVCDECGYVEPEQPEEPDEPEGGICPKCGGNHGHSLFDRFACLFTRIFRLFNNMFSAVC